MIHRRIFKIKTLGSRQTRDLRPAISDDLPKGLNCAVHEYNETEGWCIIETWCSDHPILKDEDRKNLDDLKALDKHSSIMQVLETHEKSPTVLGQISLSIKDTTTVDKEKKTLKFQGRTGNFLRVTKHKPHDKEEEICVVDEG